MEAQALEILNGINKPVAPDATSVSVKDSVPAPGEKPEESSRFNALEKAGILQAAAVLVSPFFGKKVKKQGGVNVFSGFDGASGAQTGLRKAGVPINKYYASEIDKNAIGFTQHNYPETIQLGDIRDIDVSKLEPMDYGFFGFPCQSLSSANHNGNIGLRDMTTGEVLATLDQYEAALAAGHELSSSSLFYEALKQAMALKKANPEIRLSFENVASMQPEFRKIIDDNLKQYLDLDPAFEMNTKGPTNRKRVLWTNAITADDYNALSERMKQVMPEDIIDQKAHHNLSAKGAKDAQTDLFDDKGGEVSADGKFEPKTNAWLKGKLNTATAGNGAGKLEKNGLEYDMTKKEMNRSQGNPDNLGLDYGISDRQFAKLIGNGWDQYQFKPLFDRAAMEAKGNIPKSEGRLGDENALRAANATYTGIQPNSQFGTRFYHSQGSPIEKYGNEIGIPKSDTPHTYGVWESLDDVNATKQALTEIVATRPDLEAKVRPLLDKLAEWQQSGRGLDDGPSFTAHELRLLEELSVPDQFANFRTGIWNANSTKRLNQYGPLNYRIDLPAREVADRTSRDQMSIRGNFRNDIVTNVFEPIPSRYISPADYPNDPLLQGAKRYKLMRKYGVDTRTAGQLLELEKAGVNLDNPDMRDMLTLFGRPDLPITPEGIAWIDSRLAGPNAFDRNSIRLMGDSQFKNLKYHLPNTLTQVAGSYFRDPGDWGYYTDMLNVPRIKELMPAIDEYLSKHTYNTVRARDAYTALLDFESANVRAQLPKTAKSIAAPLIDMAREHGDTDIRVFYDNNARAELEQVIVGAMLDGQLPRESLDTALDLTRYVDGPVVKSLKPYLLSLSQPSQVGDPHVVANALINTRGFGAVEYFDEYVNSLSHDKDRIFARKQLAPVLYETAMEQFPERGGEVPLFIHIDD